MHDNSRSKAEKKIKFKFRWNGCNPLGACLVFRSENQDSDLTESIVEILDENHLLVIPLRNQNGILSDGYSFVEPIDIDNEVSNLIGLPEGKRIVSGIYTAQIPDDDFIYGYHIFNIENL